MNLIIGKNYVAALMINSSPALKIVVGSFYKRDTNIPLDFLLARVIYFIISCPSIYR